MNEGFKSAVSVLRPQQEGQWSGPHDPRHFENLKNKFSIGAEGIQLAILLARVFLGSGSCLCGCVSLGPRQGLGVNL